MGGFWSRITRHDDSTMMVLTYLDQLESITEPLYVGMEIAVIGLPDLQVTLIEPWRDQDQGKPAHSFANPNEIPYITYEHTGAVRTDSGVESGHWYVKLDIIKEGYLVVV
ncbi:hypothetical protein F-S17_0351 [Faustovirus]|nr:hypothetical protein F-LCD7_0355 [Faustovirus]QJX72123.1 hypothetical protein F-M6_0360 [Faustovirus]QJX72617.1 hypothetical protein F-S17_0351 [Faustovirus]QJX73114.1 hypothetical protein F-VV57_0353 [Faustovirus]QJX73621.1 hypothetical protein F-VV63_0355 [Faustovirus]